MAHDFPPYLLIRLHDMIQLNFTSVDYMCVSAKSLQSCPTLCDPMDYSPPDSSVHGTFQAGILEWFAISFSRGKEELDIAKATTLQIQCWETASLKRVRRASFHFHAVQDSQNQSVVPE